MARRIFESLACWPNLDGNRPSIPVTLSTLDGKLVVEKQPIPVDTGFTGTLLLHQETFAHFEKAELPDAESRIYRTLIGPIPMRTARARIRFPMGGEVETFVDTPKYGVGKTLIGLQALNRLELLLSGNSLETCLVRETT